MGKAKPKRPRAPNKGLAFLAAYLDQSNSSTFLNATASVKKAGYRQPSEESYRTHGCRLVTKYHDKINTWLDEEGLSEKALKSKLLSLMSADQTQFQKIKGAVKACDLPSNCRVIVTSGVVIKSEEGEDFGDGETLIAIDTEAIETQRRTLDMALKVRGMYAPEKRELTGKDGGPVELRHSADPMSIEALRNAIAAAPQK